jgi:hypothetical protein
VIDHAGPVSDHANPVIDHLGGDKLSMTDAVSADGGTVSADAGKG